MTTEWFEKRAGEPVSPSQDDPHMTLIGDYVPDWVRLPPELGGSQQRVTGVAVERCPRADHRVRHLKLDNGVCVAECAAHGGFLWYRPREDS